MELESGLAAGGVQGADIFSRESSGETVAAQYARQGVRMTRAGIGRIAGWAAVLAALGDADYGIKPLLFISTRCRKLLEQLPVVQGTSTRGPERGRFASRHLSANPLR